MNKKEIDFMFLGFLFNGLTPPPTKFSFVVLDDYFYEEANVVADIRGSQKGRVQLHGVYWFAKLSDPTANDIQAGSSVSVVDRENNTLVVVLAD